MKGAGVGIIPTPPPVPVRHHADQHHDRRGLKVHRPAALKPLAARANPPALPTLPKTYETFDDTRSNTSLKPNIRSVTTPLQTVNTKQLQPEPTMRHFHFTLPITTQEMVTRSSRARSTEYPDIGNACTLIGTIPFEETKSKKASGVLHK